MDLESRSVLLGKTEMAVSGGARKDPQSLAQAAEEFEALFASTLLRMARESSDGGWLGGQDQAGTEGIIEFAEQSIARAMAAQGIFGIKHLITRALQGEANHPAKSTP